MLEMPASFRSVSDGGPHVGFMPLSAQECRYSKIINKGI